MRTKRILALLLSAVLLLGIMPITTIAAEMPIPVTTEGRTFSLFTEDNLEDQFGTTFLYVVKKDGRYYTPSQPDSVSDFEYFDSVAAIDITDYWNSATNTFSDIPDSLNVGAFEYQSNPFPGDYGSYVFFIDEDIMFSLRVPSENSGETWFEGGLCYADREQYLYRPIWESLGDGKGYLWDSQYDQNEDGMVLGVLALKGTDRFALKNMSDEYNADESIDVNAYLYASPCNHPTTDHSYYDAPTCMDKGCEEYWHCEYCRTYFKNAECTEAYKCRPVIPALGHDYRDRVCENCNAPIPQYTKITSYEQFRTIEEGASFIVVAEIDDGNGGKEYYALKEPVNFVSSDIDEDGDPDILHIDDDANGTPDVLELDKDGDGIADVYAWDGCFDEPDGVLDDMEIEEYLYYLEREYTNGYMVYNREVESVKVNPEKDGTISVKDMGVLEFIMERKIPDSLLGDQYYGDGATIKDYENDFMFRIPNFWVRPMITIDNNRYLMPYEMGDSKWWGILFGKDVKELRPEFFESYPDDSAVIYTESFHSFNNDGEIEYGIRFLVNGDKKTFIITSEFFYGEEIVGTQIPVYLYSSDAGGEIHEHVWGDWASYNDESHRRFCTVDGCSDFEIALHDTTGTEYIPDAENYELGHWVTCCICNEQIHEYHTMEMAYPRNNKYWRDTADGVHHVVNCTKCLGPVEYGEHRWEDWYAGSMKIDGEWVMGHYTSCKDWPCEASKWQADCLYDEGTVTLKPTCTEKGIITYTCTAESCSLETRVYTEEIPALEHDWGDWTVSSTDPTKEERICNNDNSHVEERSAHEHDWSAWTPDEENDGHSRSCSECGTTETETHNWGNGEEVTPPTCEEPGVISYACPDCRAIKSEETDSLGHDWSDWTYDSVDSHIRECKRGCGVAEEFEGHEWGEWTSDGEATHSMECSVCHGKQTEDHDWDEGVVTKEATEFEKGTMLYTCLTCDETKEEDIDRLNHTHAWSDWADNGDGTHSRNCSCTDVETEDCSWDEGTVTVDPTHDDEGEIAYTCTVCGGTKTESIPAVGHEMEEHKALEPDCENTGLIGYFYCTLCQNAYADEEGTVLLTEIESIPALGHDFGEWTDADTFDGHIRTCQRENCGFSESEAHDWSDWENLNSNEHRKICSVCDAERIASHAWGEYTALSETSHVRYCEEIGCDASETEDHVCDNWTEYDEQSHIGECKICRIGLLESHEWSDWRASNVVGEYFRTCICGAEMTMVIDENSDPVNKTNPEENSASASLDNTDIELIGAVLNDSEQIDLTKGETTVSVYLEVEDIPLNEVDPDEAKAAEELLDEADEDETEEKIGIYLDIDLLKEITNVGSGTTEVSAVTETNGKVKITIEIPADLINTDANVERSYRIIRVHMDQNGDLVTDVIEGEFDPDTNLFTFETDKFSTYALAYKDKSIKNFTVVYTDGVAGQTVFADQSYTALKGSATPSFIGTPVRDGYSFAGWTPAVSATVTANVTYTAKWTEVPKGPSHIHMYSFFWRSDASKHWNSCACGVVVNSAPHSDTDNDGICDVCKYVMFTIPEAVHTHSFSDSWVRNDMIHWRECECGTATAIAPHSDANADYYCDTCGYALPVPPAPAEPHVHNYSAKIDGNKVFHWHECSCGQIDFIEVHVDANSDNLCDVCAYKMPVEEVIESPVTDDDFSQSSWVVCLTLGVFTIAALTVIGKRSFR